jgi:membrane protease YdiL (CAAX protease family)
MTKSPHASSLIAVLWRALLWIVAASIGGAVAAFVAGLACGVLIGAAGLDVSRSNIQLFGLVAASLVSAWLFYAGARREAARPADAEGRTALDAPMRRRWFVPLACLIACPIGFALAAGFVAVSPDVRPALAGTSRTGIAVLVLVISTVTPIAEESFFRGWLWRACAARSGPTVAALLSSVLFLLAHVPEALLRGNLVAAGGRMLILLPLVVILAATRALCGTPRAPMIVHGLYNLVVGATPSLLIGAGLFGF